VRYLIAAFALPALLAAQDPVEIVRRSIELDRHNTEAARNYTYLERQERRELDGRGGVKKVESETHDVTLLEGSPYRRLVARNDAPLQAKEQRKEMEKLQKSIAERQKETPERRAARIADWERKQAKQREPVTELPEAFRFTLAGEEKVNGAVAYVLDAVPKQGYKPKSTAMAFLAKVKARIWISKADYQWVKVEMESLDTITLGGFLVRVARGCRLTFDAARVNDEVWLPKTATLKGQVRIALVKLFRGEILYTFSEYKKFQTDSRVLPQ